MASGNHSELNERRFRSMSTISTKSPCYANRAGDEADVEARGPDPDLDPSSRAGTGADPAQTPSGRPQGYREAHSRPFSGNLTRFPSTCSRTPAGRSPPLGPRARLPEHAQQKRLAGHAPAQRGPRAPGRVERHISPTGAGGEPERGRCLTVKCGGIANMSGGWTPACGNQDRRRLLEQ